MMKMFGNRSDIFVEPKGRFNNDTTKVMEVDIINYIHSKIGDLSNDTKNGSQCQRPSQC